MNRALRQEWVTAGYGPKMGSAEVVHPPPKGILRVYHLTSAEFAISDIGLGRMKVARFSDLNDPFELMALNFREQPARKTINDSKTDYDSHTGLLCFSANWANSVLWSHYGAKHRGICIGFDIKRTLVEQVKYEDERILRNFGTGDPRRLNTALQDLLRCTKYSHWRYEEEFRRFVSLKDTIKEGSLHFYQFDDGLQVREVFLGPQCNLSLDAVRRLTQAHYNNAVTFKARLAVKFFAVVPDEGTVS